MVLYPPNVIHFVLVLAVTLSRYLAYSGDITNTILIMSLVQNGYLSLFILLIMIIFTGKDQHIEYLISIFHIQIDSLRLVFESLREQEAIKNAVSSPKHYVIHIQIIYIFKLITCQFMVVQ